MQTNEAPANAVVSGMALSQVVALVPPPIRAFGIDVDCYVAEPPESIREIGFLARFDDQALHDDVVDVLIGFEIAKVASFVEVPAEMPIPSPEALMRVAASVGFSVCLLPPVTDDDEAFEAYAVRLESFVGLYAKQANFSKSLLPITSFLEYLFVEQIDPSTAAAFRPTNPYVLERFASVVTTERSDGFKDRMRKAFQAVYGEEGFAEYLKACVGEICRDADRSMADFKRQLDEENERRFGIRPDRAFEGEPSGAATVD